MSHVKWFYRYILVVSLALLLLPASLWAGSYEKGLLWSVSKAGQPDSFIFGTMHSEHPSVLKLPAVVERTFQSSKSFTAELKLDMDTMLQTQQLMMLPSNSSLQDIVGQHNYQQSARLMQDYGIPQMMVDKMKPWAIAVTLQVPKPKTGMALDIMLYQQAQLQGKQVHGLETITEQLSLFDDMPTPQQIKMLEQSIKDYPTMQTKISTMMELYLKQDIGGLMHFSEKEMQRMSPELAKRLEKKMLVERNYRMIERMRPQLKEGGAFIAIGALHLPGQQGVLQLLENQGYIVKAKF